MPDAETNVQKEFIHIPCTVETFILYEIYNLNTKFITFLTDSNNLYMTPVILYHISPY
jgi:hypothetical protein